MASREHAYSIIKPEDKPSFSSRVWLTSITPDLAFATNNISIKISREVGDQLATSDHRPIILHIDATYTSVENSTIPRWNFKKS